MAALGDLLSHDDALVVRAAEALGQTFGRGGADEAVALYVPGRVEFLGKHTDYTGGRALLLAADRGFRLVACPRDDNLLRFAAAAVPGDTQQFAFGETPPHEAGHWVNYVATVARRVEMNFAAAVDLRGADIAFVSDLPPAAGMSSSSALMVSTFLALSAVNGFDQTDAYRAEIDSRLQLAEYLGCVENGQSFGSLAGEAGVGTFGGSEDHAAMLCCKAGMLSQIAFSPAMHERDIPFPAAAEMVVAASGVHAVKTGAAKDHFNRASLRASRAAEVFNRATGADCRHLRDVLERVGPDGVDEAVAAIRRGSEPADAELDLPGRFVQFVREYAEIIPAVADALAAGELDAIGPLVDASHAGAVEGLQNQAPQTDSLQILARRLGAIAATSFGAGFGGSVWAMVARGRGDEFADTWRTEYAKEFPAEAELADFFTTTPGKPAEVLAQ